LDVIYSVDFIQKVQNISLTENEFLASFDVESLYPSIPIGLALQYMIDWVVSKRVDPHKIICYKDLMKCYDLYNLRPAWKKFFLCSGTKSTNKQKEHALVAAYHH
jgi:hypothetical protein